MRSFKLDPETYSRVREGNQELQRRRSAIESLCNALIDKQVEEERIYWEDLKKLINAEPEDSLCIKWMLRTIEIRTLEES